MLNVLGVVVVYRFADGYQCLFRVHEFATGAGSILDWLESKHGKAELVFEEQPPDDEGSAKGKTP